MVKDIPSVVDMFDLGVFDLSLFYSSQPEHVR